MHRRGLTMLEVLLATVILAALSIVCLPVVREAFAVLNEASPDAELVEVWQLADAICEDPESFGLDLNPATLSSSSNEPVAIAWPDHADRPPALLRMLTLQASETDRVNDRDAQPPTYSETLSGIWIVVSHGPWEVFRWVHAEIDQQENDAGGDWQ